MDDHGECDATFFGKPGDSTKGATNLETPFDQVDSYLTPTELFYIRSHFQAPQLEPDGYQLRIDGAVRKPFSLCYEAFRQMPSETRVATLECTGNGRVFLVPQAAGANGNSARSAMRNGPVCRWQHSSSSAGLDADACEIVLEGADRGTPKEEPVPPGPISYARSLPGTKPSRGTC